MPFNNDIAGGNGSLVRNWIQSPNFVAGSTGWRIAKDGSCEFNNGTFRGSITSGNPAGQHVVINNGSTGDAVDVYNTLNQLVAFIDALGRIETLNPSTGQFSRLASGSAFLGNTGSASGQPAELLYTFNAGGTGRDLLQLFSGHEPGDSDSSITLGSDVGSAGNGFIRGFQRAITGSLMQSDQTSINNLVHVGKYNFTSNVNGDTQVNHGASFTPTAAFIQGTQTSFTQQATQYFVWFDLITSTVLPFRALQAGGAPYVGNGTIYAVMFG